MKEKQIEIIKLDGNEKEKDSAIVRLNTYNTAVVSEQTLFKQELGVDMMQAGQVYHVIRMANAIKSFSRDSWRSKSTSTTS